MKNLINIATGILAVIMLLYLPPFAYSAEGDFLTYYVVGNKEFVGALDKKDEKELSEYPFIIVKRDEAGVATNIWPCGIENDSDGYPRGVIIYPPKRTSVGFRNGIQLTKQLCELGGHENKDLICLLLNQINRKHGNPDSRPNELDSCLIADNYQGVISLPAGKERKKYLVLKPGARLGTGRMKSDILFFDEKDILGQIIHGTIHHTWAYPTSCVTLPDPDKNEVQEVIDELTALTSGGTKAHVYLFGFADKQERENNAQQGNDQVNYNLVVSRARVLGWKQLINKKFPPKKVTVDGREELIEKVDVKDYWFGHELHNDLFNNTTGLGPIQYSNTTIPKPDTSLNRRVEIYISTTENPSPVSEWKALWEQQKAAKKIFTTSKGWVKANGKRVIKDDLNLPGKLEEIVKTLLELTDMEPID